MGYFSIILPDERRAEVRFGKIIKKSVHFFDLFRNSKKNREEKTGYIVKIEPPGDKQLYHFLKSQQGEWLSEGDAGFAVNEHDEISVEMHQPKKRYR